MLLKCLTFPVIQEIRISLNDLAEQERLPSLRYVSNHFLFDTSVFSLALIFHCSALRHAVNNTHEQGVKI